MDDESTPESGRSGYHHGDLRASLLSTAMEMLEAGESFSLRAVANYSIGLPGAGATTRCAPCGAVLPPAP